MESTSPQKPEQVQDASSVQQQIQPPPSLNHKTDDSEEVTEEALPTNTDLETLEPALTNASEFSMVSMDGRYSRRQGCCFENGHPHKDLIGKKPRKSSDGSGSSSGSSHPEIIYISSPTFLNQHDSPTGSEASHVTNSPNEHEVRVSTENHTTGMQPGSEHQNQDATNEQPHPDNTITTSSQTTRKTTKKTLIQKSHKLAKKVGKAISIFLLCGPPQAYIPPSRAQHTQTQGNKAQSKFWTWVDGEDRVAARKAGVTTANTNKTNATANKTKNGVSTGAGRSDELTGQSCVDFWVKPSFEQRRRSSNSMRISPRGSVH